MKLRKKNLLVFFLAGLMGASAVPLIASARPKSPEERREERQDRREERQDRREERREDRQDRRENRRERRKERRDNRRERREDWREARKEWREKRREARRKLRTWRKGARKAWRAKWRHRRRVARRAFINRWGVLYKVPAAKKELALHAWREARFERMRYLAEVSGNEELLKKINDLEDKEDDRHDARMEAIDKAEGGGSDAPAETEAPEAPAEGT